MKDIIREAPLGQLIRFATKNRYFKYPEEIAGFQVPSCYCENAKEKLEGSDSSPPSEKATELPIDRNPHDDELANIETHRESTDIEHHASLIKSRTKTQPFSEDRFEVEQELAVERTKTRPIIAEKTSDGTILVDWYTTDDPANPQNWSQGKKALVAFLICCYTFVVYCSSSIIVSAEPGIMEYFGVGYFKGSLTLAIYVLACKSPSSDSTAQI
jgi:DHA1 family multidrug resistance protein-like MFS transporter